MQSDLISLRHPALDLDLYYINWVMRMPMHLDSFLIIMQARVPHSQCSEGNPTQPVLSFVEARRLLMSEGTVSLDLLESDPALSPFILFARSGTGLMVLSFVDLLFLFCFTSRWSFQL